MEKQWYVYMVQCRDGTFYTGITDNISKRMEVHNAGKGAKYTRSRRPVTLVFSEKEQSHSRALQREHEIKQLTRQQKEGLILEAEKNEGCVYSRNEV